MPACWAKWQNWLPVAVFRPTTAGFFPFHSHTMANSLQLMAGSSTIRPGWGWGKLLSLENGSRWEDMDIRSGWGIDMLIALNFLQIAGSATHPSPFCHWYCSSKCNCICVGLLITVIELVWLAQVGKVGRTKANADRRWAATFTHGNRISRPDVCLHGCVGDATATRKLPHLPHG